VISSLVLTGICIFILLVYLSVEKYQHVRRLKKLPLRICVTGTRGKSSVTRLLAGVLNASGLASAAKITGSRPVFISPDGAETVLFRRGLPSILEGKRFIKMVLEASAQSFVAEMMSIRPETLNTESLRILRPQILVITNVRMDHREHMGYTAGEIAKSFAAAIPFHGTVFVPEEEFFPVFEETARQRGSRIICVPKIIQIRTSKEIGSGLDQEWEQNIRLAKGVGQFLELEDRSINAGMLESNPDIGGLKIWSIKSEARSSKWLAINAFAANDPGSTIEVLKKLRIQDLFSRGRILGILNLRMDRGDRTLQWLQAIQQGQFSEFDGMMLIGGHAIVLNRKFRSMDLDTIFWHSRSLDPEEIMKRLRAEISGQAVLIGMGNMGGIGRRFVGLWEKTGEAYGI
jgi:poly-gamma-glutamate synthase PgsB/CapB